MAFKMPMNYVKESLGAKLFRYGLLTFIIHISTDYYREQCEKQYPVSVRVSENGMEKSILGFELDVARSYSNKGTCIN